MAFQLTKQLECLTRDPVFSDEVFDILCCKSDETIHVPRFRESYNFCTLHHESDATEVTTGSDITTRNMS